MSDLLKLAERCEQATGPDLVLDKYITHELYPGDRDMQRCCDSGSFRPTKSIDAAMNVASGFGGQVTFFKDGTAKAYLWQPYPLAIYGKAATPALSLCAAALRARAASGMEARQGGNEVPCEARQPNGEAGTP